MTLSCRTCTKVASIAGLHQLYLSCVLYILSLKGSTSGQPYSRKMQAFCWHSKDSPFIAEFWKTCYSGLTMSVDRAGRGKEFNSYNSPFLYLCFRFLHIVSDFAIVIWSNRAALPPNLLGARVSGCPGFGIRGFWVQDPVHGAFYALIVL